MVISLRFCVKIGASFMKVIQQWHWCDSSGLKYIITKLVASGTICIIKKKDIVTLSKAFRTNMLKSINRLIMTTIYFPKLQSPSKIQNKYLLYCFILSQMAKTIHFKSNKHHDRVATIKPWGIITPQGLSLMFSWGQEWKLLFFV